MSYPLVPDDKTHTRKRRLLLRPMRLSDAEDIFLIRSRRDVIQWT